MKKIIYNNIIPFGSYRAINIFGRIFAKKKFEPLDTKIINHESIHTSQIRENLYIFFYLKYIFFYLKGLITYKNHHKSYENIPFEKEAYLFDNVMNYNSIRYRKSYRYIGFLFICKLDVISSKISFLDKNLKWTYDIENAQKFQNFKSISSSKYNEYITSFEDLIRYIKL